MDRKVFTLIFEDFFDAIARLEIFNGNILNSSKWIAFLSGSFCNMPLSLFIAAGCRDVDGMYEHPKLAAFDADPCNLIERSGVSFLRICTCDVHDGYARLLMQDGREMKHDELFNKLIRVQHRMALQTHIHGPAVCKPLRNKPLDESQTKSQNQL